MKFFKTIFTAGLIIYGAGNCFAANTTVTADSIAAAPVLDGNAAEWSAVAATTLQVAPSGEGDAKNYTGAIDVTIKSAVHGDNIYFLLEWPDDTKDDTHKTLTWNKEEDGYVEGKDREDRAVLQFNMGGDFTSCMLSGKEYKADIWHWKAYRSGSKGYVHDKMHIMSKSQLPKAKEHPTRDGGKIWIARPGDQGNNPIKSQKPIDNIGEVVPRYLVADEWTGSIGDIRAAATHDGSKWVLEMQRKLDTGNDDDVKFVKGKSYSSAVAIFNHTGDDHHSTTGFTLDIK